jgi:glyoxylase-like metal-dependent hydrolase (beta-lactamase superfamily II)
MKKTLFAIILLTLTASAQEAEEVSPFKQVSDHCYVLMIEENGENIAFTATGQGVLLFDPPPEPDLTILVDYLRKLNAGPVRWMVNTGLYLSRTAGMDYFASQGAVLISGFRQQELKMSRPGHPSEGSEPFENPGTESGLRAYDEPKTVSILFPTADENSVEYAWNPETETPAWPQFIFKSRMYLFPEDVEIEIQELPYEARTGADTFAYVPDEKVLFTGRLFEPGYYPDIDVSTGGSAVRWVDALEEVIDSVPLLISAIPPEEPEEEEGVAAAKEGEEGFEEEEEEKTLEEMITVVSARGEVSNLQVMKDMLDTSKKLRSSISRTVKAGRSCERFLDSSAAESYRIYGNFYSYATHLCRELAPKEEKKPEATKPGARSQ